MNSQIEKVRNLSHDLWPMIVDDLGVDVAFENLIISFLKLVDVEPDLHMEKIGHYFSVEQQRHLYRMMQESLNNIIKHADASSVQIVAKKREDVVVLAIHDNGVGFDTQAVARDTGTARGMGLQAMDERVKILNGTMEIHSEPGTGSSLLFTIGIDEQ